MLIANLKGPTKPKRPKYSDKRIDTITSTPDPESVEELLFGDKEKQYKLNSKLRLKKKTLNKVLNALFNPLKESYYNLQQMFNFLPVDEYEDEIPKLFFNKAIDDAKEVFRKIVRSKSFHFT